MEVEQEYVAMALMAADLSTGSSDVQVFRLTPGPCCISGPRWFDFKFPDSFDPAHSNSRRSGGVGVRDAGKLAHR